MRRVKAQGLSLNAIVIAALVLIVLVVLVMIFTGRLGIFNAGLKEDVCTTMGGQRAAACNENQDQLMVPAQNGQFCCKAKTATSNANTNPSPTAAP